MVDRRQVTRRAERGLSLVELLVVITILALASSLVLINAPPGRSGVRKDAERLAAKLIFAEDDAITSGVHYRLALDATGYWFEKRVDGEWKGEGAPKGLRMTPFAKSTTAVVTVDDKAFANADALGASDQPKGAKSDDKVKYVRLDPLGSSAAFTVTLSSPDGRWLVTSDAAGDVEAKHE